MSSRGGARQTLPDSRPAGKRGREPDSPDTPTSPPRSAGPLTRKRAASLRSEPRIEELSLDTPTTSSASSNRHPVEKVRERELICLCTPAPKVPRPRNGMCQLSPLSTQPPLYQKFPCLLSPPLPSFTLISRKSPSACVPNSGYKLSCRPRNSSFPQICHLFVISDRAPASRLGC